MFYRANIQGTILPFGHTDWYTNDAHKYGYLFSIKLDFEIILYINVSNKGIIIDEDILGR